MEKINIYDKRGGKVCDLMNYVYFCRHETDNRGLYQRE